MSAQPNAVLPSEIWPLERHFAAMTVKHLDLLMPIEAAAYDFPWSRGNFIDSLGSGYPAFVLYDAHAAVLGYFVAMVGVDEWHLLNITVAPAHQACGHGRFLLDHVVSLCRAQGAAMVWLEVRRSNARAQAIYWRYGFTEIGVRRGYYPATQGREDAVVMRMSTAAEQV